MNKEQDKELFKNHINYALNTLDIDATRKDILCNAIIKYVDNSTSAKPNLNDIPLLNEDDNIDTVITTLNLLISKFK